jgi:hypothetical protein
MQKERTDAERVRSHTFYIPISRYGLWDDHSVRALALEPGKRAWVEERCQARSPRKLGFQNDCDCHMAVKPVDNWSRSVLSLLPQLLMGGGGFLDIFERTTVRFRHRCEHKHCTRETDCRVDQKCARGSDGPVQERERVSEQKGGHP